MRRDRYAGVIQGEWRDALPKVLNEPESEFDAVFDEALAADSPARRVASGWRGGAVGRGSARCRVSWRLRCRR